MKIFKTATIIVGILLLGAGCTLQNEQIKILPSWCTDAPKELENGRLDYPINPDLALGGIPNSNFLEQVLTAGECGDARLAEVSKNLGGDSEIWKLGMTLTSSGPHGFDVDAALGKIGFECSVIGGHEGQCSKWKLTKDIPVRDLLQLKSWIEYFSTSDCVHCG